MSTIVYQELQPCCNSESHFIESRTTLSLKLNSSMKNSVENVSSNSLYGAKTTPSNSNTSGGWSSIEALPSKRDAVPKEEVVYVHPLVKRSSFMLSEKSLKMCTESLLNETGTFDMESSDGLFTSTTTTKLTTKTMKGRTTPRQKFDIRKELSLGHGKFPPPLTTIAGTSNICVRPYREDGRLIIEAVSTPPIQPCMQAERGDGRLRLSMMMEDINDNDNDNDNENDNGVEELVENDEEGLVKDVEEEVGKEEFLEECHKNDSYLMEDMNGISKELGVKLGIGKIQRLSRCKERGQGNKRLINWEPFWVAT
ncbi:protein FANTASTIC FOUR 3-like [Chenopodium quinoa]|uniref:protein FANTASTIC FOUR 3-like n=1 Tax=Chenopodium quinoa TaxID=63459 RepID=UPI000B78681F|nr:protein FANTASTIC FOUR 3-like [Chenopodium quinoa]